MKKKFFKAVKIGTATASSLALSAQLAVVSAQQQGPGGQNVPVGGRNNVGTNIDPGTGFATNIGNVINFGLQVVMVIALLLVFGYLIIGGIQWITSGGEKGKTEEARNKITNAVIGLIVLAASYALLQLLLRFLGFTDINQAINSVDPIL